MSVVKTGTGLKKTKQKTFVTVGSLQPGGGGGGGSLGRKDVETDGRTDVPPQTTKPLPAPPVPLPAHQSLWRAGKLEKHGANASVGFVCAARSI